MVETSRIHHLATPTIAATRTSTRVARRDVVELEEEPLVQAEIFKVESREEALRLYATGVLVCKPRLGLTDKDSPIWNEAAQLFHQATDHPTEYLICMVCFKRVFKSFKGSTLQGTSSVSQHLKTCSGSREQKRQKTFMASRYQEPTAKVKQSITMASVLLCVKDKKAFNIVNGQGFKDFSQAEFDIGL
jgi:hypothetical protein